MPRRRTPSCRARAAATDSAANPRAGSRWMIRRPRVRMMRQPPDQVPSEMAVAAATITQSGRLSSELTYPPVSRARKITPIVFWASWRPWPSAIAAAETVCTIRKPRLALCGLPPAEDPHDRQHQRERGGEGDDRRDEHRDDDLVEDRGPLDGGARGDRRADQAADERVRGRGRQAVVPGDQVPGDRAEQSGHHDHQAVRPGRRRDHAADGVGDLLARGRRRRSS